MTKLMRQALAGACVALACTACAMLLITHGHRGAFSAGFSMHPQPLRRSWIAPVSWPRGTVNVNAASAEALCALEGVGPSLAAAIVTERDANGFFDYPEDLLAVKGIGEKTLARFRSQLTFF